MTGRGRATRLTPISSTTRHDLYEATEDVFTERRELEAERTAVIARGEMIGKNEDGARSELPRTRTSRCIKRLAFVERRRAQGEGGV